MGVASADPFLGILAGSNVPLGAELGRVSAIFTSSRSTPSSFSGQDHAAHLIPRSEP